MLFRKAFSLSFLIFFLVLTIFFVNIYKPKAPEEPVRQGLVHQVKFYEENLFLEGINKAKSHSRQNDYQIKGGIVPHDLLASFIIADFFSFLAEQNPKTIILIGPNHYEQGNFKALTSVYHWETTYGIIENDLGLTNSLLTRELMEIDEETLAGDHSLSALLPYVKYYLPKSKIVLILLKRSIPERDTEILAENLFQLIGEDTVLIASVDFSHYLTSLEAQKKDEVTLNIIKNYNFQRLFSLDSSYLDSPASVGVLLKLMQIQKTTNLEILNHTNSGEMQKDNKMPTTSYYSITYY